MAALSSSLDLHRPAPDTTVVLGPVLHFPSLFSPDEQLALFRDLSSVAASYCAGKKGKAGGGGASYGRGAHRLVWWTRTGRCSRHCSGSRR